MVVINSVTVPSTRDKLLSRGFTLMDSAAVKTKNVLCTVENPWRQSHKVFVVMFRLYIHVKDVSNVFFVVFFVLFHLLFVFCCNITV